MVLSTALFAVLLLQQMPTIPDPNISLFKDLEVRVSSAIHQKNMPALEELLAKDFTFNLFLEGEDPEILNRGEWLKTAELYNLSDFKIRHVTVRIIGDVAVVGLQPIREATLGTGAIDRSGEFAVVDIWTKDVKHWKLSARHLSRPDKLKR